MKTRRRIRTEDVMITNGGYTTTGQPIILRDKVGNIMSLARIVRDSFTEQEAIRTEVMIDEVDKEHSVALAAIRAEMSSRLSELKAERDLAIEEYRQQARRQLDNAEFALQDALIHYRTDAKPVWPRIVFLKREDFPETQMTHDIVEKLRDQCASEMKTRSQSFWNFQFVENAFKYGLYTSEGKIDHTIMVKNRFRKVLRKTQEDYQRRLDLEKSPGYKGKRLVSFDNTPFVFKALELSIENQKYWDEVINTNRQLRQQLSEQMLERTLWYAQRKKRIRELIAMVRFARKSLIDNVAKFRERYNQLYSAAIEDFKARIQALEASFEYNEFHYLQRTASQVYDPSKRVVIPTGSVKVVAHANVLTGAHSSWVESDPSEHRYMASIDSWGPERGNYVQPNTIFDKPFDRGSVGEVLAKLGRGDAPRSQENILSMLFELRDIPKSVASLRNMFTWMKGAYSAKTLRGISFRTGAEAYLEYIYGVKPSADSIAYLIGEFRSFIEWIRTMVDPSSLLSVKVGRTQSASVKLIHDSDVVRNEPTHDSAHWYIDKQAPLCTYSSSPLEVRDPWYGIGNRTVGAVSYTLPDFFRLGEGAEQKPYCLADWEIKSYLKVFARPVRELDIAAARKLLLRNFLWDNSLGETFWNWVPFSFIADWFLGLKDMFKGLDQLLVVGWRGLEQLHQPWYRRIDEAKFTMVTPQIHVGHPTFSEDAWFVREPARDRQDAHGRNYAFRLHLRLGVECPIDIQYPWISSIKPFRKVVRDEIPADAQDLLVDAFKHRVIRAFKIRPDSGRVFAVAPQVIALGVANGAFTGVRPVGKKPQLVPEKGLKCPTSGLFANGRPRLEASSALHSLGFVVTRSSR